MLAGLIRGKGMNKAARLIAAVLATAFFCIVAIAAEAVPPLKDLRKPVEPTLVDEDEEPVVPGPVAEGARISDPARICPPNAVWYLAVPDANRLSTDWNASPPGKLSNEPAMIRTFRNNRFGLNHLFGDLPESIVTPERIQSISAALELSQVWTKMAEKIAMACYIDKDGGFSFLFLFDVGTNRVPAFEIMSGWETSFFLSNPGLDVVRGDHSGNFLDIWRLKNKSNAKKPSEVAAGFINNMAIVSNNPQIAATCMELAAGGENLAGSQWGQRLAASIPTSSSADAVAYLRMDALLEGLKNTPLARNSVAGWADYFGHGGQNGEAIYYGLQFTEEGTRETFLLPSADESASASLLELLAKRLKPVQRWTAHTVIPYQPNPAFYMSAMIEGRQLGGLLKQDTRLFGVSSSSAAFAMPAETRALFTNELVTLLTGEIGMSFFPGTEKAPGGWLMAIPCTSNPSPLLKKSDIVNERNGTSIYSKAGDWRNETTWSVASSSTFRRLNGHFLLVASKGDLIIAALDQLMSGSSFASNKDFSRMISQTEAGQGLLFYMNIPEIVVRQYPNLSYIMRMIYPRSAGLNSRPPLALLRRYSRGLLGVIAPNGDGEADFTRVTVQAPVPSFGMLAAGTVLGFPLRLRADGRIAMETSRENLKNLWLRLHLYASRFGHFPDTLDDLVSDMRMTMTDEEIRSMMTAPAALSRLSPEEAATGSYKYLSGVTPNDEPDLPVIYEAEPWSDDFAGMYPRNTSRGPSESGDYQPYRQMILLNGQVVVTTEKRFQEVIVKRLRERE